MIKHVFGLGLIFVPLFHSPCKAQTAPPAASSRLSGKISAEERQALVALYNATDGDHWKNHHGWPGAPGTECDWYGVRCGQTDDSAASFVVDALEFYDNGLEGRIPGSVGTLTHLERLDLIQNKLSGVLPTPLIRRWLSGALFIAAEASLFTTVSEIDFEDSPSALLCARRRIIFRSDGSAVEYNVLCRNAAPGDRETYCEVRNAHILGPSFAVVASTLDKNNFYSLQPRYERNVTDASFDSTRVIRNGKSYEVVEYAGGGPFELWSIDIAIQGIASTPEWEKPTTEPRCPEWDVSDERPAK